MDAHVTTVALLSCCAVAQSRAKNCLKIWWIATFTQNLALNPVMVSDARATALVFLALALLTQSRYRRAKNFIV